MSAPLVSASDLSAHLGDPNWAIFDCRFDLANPSAGMASYLKGHIDGAHFADLDRHLAGAKTGHNGRHPLPERDQLASFFREHGVGLDTFVVAYDAREGMYAARLWWLMRWLGHQNVAVLDGGLAGWQEAGLPIDDRIVTVSAPGDFKAQAPLNGFVSIDKVADLKAHGLVLIDARAAARYRGEMEPLDRTPGHIPGALNRPYTDNLDATGHFLAPAALRSAFLDIIGETDPSKVVNSCGSGVTACHNLLAMEVAGLHNALLYPGSYSEWSSDPSRPISVAA
jgi:thiosulfate/3-mercaptopyruvate sulfurtransferase